MPKWYLIKAGRGGELDWTLAAGPGFHPDTARQNPDLLFARKSYSPLAVKYALGV